MLCPCYIVAYVSTEHDDSYEHVDVWRLYWYVLCKVCQEGWIHYNTIELTNICDMEVENKLQINDM
jgi:hypothetical protein